MPMQDDVDVVEKSGSHHINFAGAALFGGRAVEADRAFLSGSFHPVLYRNCRFDRTSPEQMMAASVTGVEPGTYLLFGYGCLRDARKCIEFSEYTDHWMAGAKAGSEGGGDFRDARLNRETLLLELFLK